MSHKKPVVLIVDDHPENIHILLENLKDDFAVVAATSGLQAIQMANSDSKPDIILLDIIMPEMDGYEVCRRLKAEARTVDIPIIFVTSISEKIGIDPAKNMGAAGHLTKPINPFLLKESIFKNLQNSKVQTSGTPATIETKRTGETIMRYKQTILIVDDQPENLQILVETLKAKYAVTVATSGPQALEITSKPPYPDLIIMDVIMPDMNGFEVCKRIKQRPELEPVPIIFVTVMEAVEDILMGFQMGGVDYVTKPYRIEELKARVETHLKLQEQQSELEMLIEHLKESQLMNIQQARASATGELLRNIAHQWRQPLSMVSLGLENMLESCQHDELNCESMEGDVNRILDVIRNMSDMIQDFSRLFKPDDEIEEFAIEKAIKDALHLLQSNIDEEQINITVDIQSPCTINGYYNEYFQVLMLILSNAFELLKEKNVPSKQVKITLSKTQENHSTLSIKDNAGGIAANLLEKLFEPYTSTKHAYQGVGLNLFICKMLIEKHMKGVLQAKNTEQGAEFTIII